MLPVTKQLPSPPNMLRCKQPPTWAWNMGDLMIQPITHSQPSYFQDSFTLKTTLATLNIPPNALLFTADAKSMCTIIQTGPPYTTSHNSSIRRKTNPSTP